MKALKWILPTLCLLTLAACEYQDNTGRPTRERENAAMTPRNQGESEGDLDVTKAIRTQIDSDGSLSTNAKNIKINTTNGDVTLHGVVDSKQEKDQIEQKAKSVNGVKNVNNQLEVRENRR